MYANGCWEPCCWILELTLSYCLCFPVVIYGSVYLFDNIANLRNLIHALAIKWFIYNRLCDESLRWLIVNGHTERTIQLLQKITTKNKKDPEIILPLISDNIHGIHTHEHVKEMPEYAKVNQDKTECVQDSVVESNTHSLIDIFRHKLLLKRTLIWMFIW